MTCREAVLAAFERLERRHERREIDLSEVVGEVLAHTSQFAESTIRTHITSRMCANATSHHATVYADLKRVARGCYRRRP